MAGEFEQNRTVFLKFRQYRKEGLQEKEPEQNKGRQWISLLTDQDSFVEKNAGVKTTDPLHFPDYKKKLKKMKELTNEEDAVITGYAKVEKTPVVLCVLNGDFMKQNPENIWDMKVDTTIIDGKTVYEREAQLMKEEIYPDMIDFLNTAEIPKEKFINK